MTVYTDNAAGRLHKLLSAFNDAVSSSPFTEVWAQALDEAMDSAEFVRRFALVCGLPGQIQSELSKIELDDAEISYATGWVDQVSHSLDSVSEWNDFHNEFSGDCLASLEFCSLLLHRHRPERVLAADEVRRIGELIDELEAAIRDTDLDGKARDFLLFHANAMRRALEDLALGGSVALEGAFDRAVGATQRRADLTVRIDSTTTGAWQKFFNVLVGVAAVFQIATSSLALPGQILQELEGTHPAATIAKVVVEDPQAPGVNAPNDGAALPTSDNAAPGNFPPVSSQAAGP